MIVWTILLFLTLTANTAFADFSGPVIDVLDGDTIKVSRNNRNVTIRLNGIDTPEKGQAYGHQAGEFVAIHAFGQTVTVQTFGLDKYGRTLADVLPPNGTNVNHVLVKDGWIWWYRKYAPADRVVEGLETEAREWRGTMGTALFPTTSVPHASMGSRHDVHTKDDAGVARPDVRPGFLLRGLSESTARDSDRPPSPQHDHPS